MKEMYWISVVGNIGDVSEVMIFFLWNMYFTFWIFFSHY